MTRPDLNDPARHCGHTPTAPTAEQIADGAQDLVNYLLGAALTAAHAADQARAAATAAKQHTPKAVADLTQTITALHTIQTSLTGIADRLTDCLRHRPG